MRLWIPLPRTEAHQVIYDLHLASPFAYRIYASKQFGDRYASLRVNAVRVRTPFDVRLTFRAIRFEYKVTFPPNDPPPSQAPFPPAIAHDLLPARLIPIDGLIGGLSRQQTRGISDPLAKARKIYDYVINTMHYDHKGTGWGHGNAIYACTAHRGNCTDFHSLFIGMARAAGIPARFEIGFYLPPGQAAGKLASYHCWAEFYVRRIGWIPVDAAEAWLQPTRRNFYFGALNRDRVRFTRGRDLVLSPRQAARPLNYFVYPYAELDGKPFSGLGYQFSFRDLPAEPGAARAASASSDSRSASSDTLRSGAGLAVGKAISPRRTANPFGEERDSGNLK
jgi:transglutaminase-like putative cysteine protease